MDDFMTRQVKHYEALADLSAELHGVIGAVLDSVACGAVTAQQAVDLIRALFEPIEAKRKAAWDAYARRPVTEAVRDECGGDR